MAKKKIYAVKIGRKPGIYDNWEDCKAQVSGFPGAQYKGFGSYGEAGAYMDNACDPLPDADTNTSSDKPAPDFDEKYPYAFVDGSFNPETGIYGYGGFLVYNGKRYPLQGSDSIPEIATMRNVAGEVEGSMAAVRLAEELGIPALQLLYDYMGIEQWAKNWKAKETGSKRYKEFITSPERAVRIKFIKVKGHTGVAGNEMADWLAKDAVGVPLTGPQRAAVEELKNQE